MPENPISHLTIGTNDETVASVFYDAVLAVIGFGRLEKPAGLPPAYAVNNKSPYIFVMKPFDGNLATIGNGSHIAFEVDTAEAVDEFYKTALARGGNDEGAPGIRENYASNYYAAYIRDLDGNKLQAVCYL